MRRHAGLLITLTIVLLLGVVSSAMVAFNVTHPSAFPFTIRDVNIHTAALEPVPGIALPDGLYAGDHIDLAQQPLRTRVAIAKGQYGDLALPPEEVYRFIVERGLASVPIHVRTIGWERVPEFRSAQWLTLFANLFSGVIALVALWRGRNRSAAGLALFAAAYLLGRAVTWTPLQGAAGLAALLGAWTLYLLGRMGFYLMAESMAGAALGARARLSWRTGFFVLLGAGAIVALVGPLVYVATGWAGLLPRPYGLLLTVSYLVPVALLIIGYHRAGSADRARLRWMLWGGGLFAVGILALDTAALGPASLIASEFAQSLGLAAFLYAILRHRVVEIKVVISRTLVYAMTTSLVLGLFALFESLLERTAIGHSASLALELAVPLGVGVSLSTVHRRIDTLVDRLIFRHQYREEMALRRFAKESAFVSQAETLLDLTVEHILLHVGAPWVAFYEYGSDGYRRVRQRGERDLPQAVATDDLALVKLRAHDSDVDLQEAASGLGREGYAFPLRARDHLLGVLVVGPRPGEHYAAEERELIAHVAHAVGASLFALRARASETLLSESRARESALLDALRALGAAPRVSAER